MPLVNGLNTFNHVVAECDIDTGDVFFELLQGGRPDQVTDKKRLAIHKGQRHLGWRQAVAACQIDIRGRSQLGLRA